MLGTRPCRRCRYTVAFAQSCAAHVSRAIVFQSAEISRSHTFFILTRDASALVRFGALACVDALVNSLREAVRDPLFFILPGILLCSFCHAVGSSPQYLVLAAETAPFLYEVEEDDDEVHCLNCCRRHILSDPFFLIQAVEALAQRIVKNLEAMLGESLQDYSS
jgi:hypothetical protein